MTDKPKLSICLELIRGNKEEEFINLVWPCIAELLIPHPDDTECTAIPLTQSPEELAFALRNMVQRLLKLKDLRDVGYQLSVCDSRIGAFECWWFWASAYWQILVCLLAFDAITQ